MHILESHIAYLSGVLSTRTGLDSLELPRLRYDLIFTYKVLYNKLYIDNDGNYNSLFSFNPSFNTRGNVCKLYLTRCAV